MQKMCAVLLVGLLVLSHAAGAEETVKKSLGGRWGVVEDKPAAPVAKPPASGKGSTRAKPPALAKAPDELPKAVLEFTDDGKVRLDGNMAAFAGRLKAVKLLGDYGMRVSPETKNIKITYEVAGEQQIEIAADNLWLLEKLSGGGQGQIAPEKLKELMAEYQPREKFKVAATAKELTLTNEDGKTLKFRRFTGKSLSEEEGKRREEDLRKGLSPLKDILEKQGIKTKPDDKPTAPKKDKP